jgi:hypothetical protein
MIIFPLIILYLMKEYCNLFFSFIGFRIPAGGKYIFLLHSDQTGSEAHPASYTKGSGNPFPGGKAAWA